MAYSDSYFATRETWRDWRIEARELMRLARVMRDVRVLEIGCGGGGLLRLLRERGARTVGVDTSKDALRLARKRVRVGDFSPLLPLSPSPRHSFTSAKMARYHSALTPSTRSSVSMSSNICLMWMPHCASGGACSSCMDGLRSQHPTRATPIQRTLPTRITRASFLPTNCATWLRAQVFLSSSALRFSHFSRACAHCARSASSRTAFFDACRTLQRAGARL